MMNLPEHKAGLTLQHNEHRNYYDPVEQWIVDHDDIFNWVSEDEKKRAIETDSVWTLQWYPDTPVGFYAIAASTLEALLEGWNSGATGA